MRQLDRDEKDVRERAGLRARELTTGDVGGSVELHDPSATNHEARDVEMSDIQQAAETDAESLAQERTAEAAASSNRLQSASQSVSMTGEDESFMARVVDAAA